MGANEQPEPPKRGRPPGSVSLTTEIQAVIVSLIRSGAFAEAAAEAAGISARTFRDWIERGEGRHPSRRATRKLAQFAAAVRQARAEARVGAEVRVYRENPRHWLAYAARSRPGAEGWSKPVQEKEEEVRSPSERLAELIRRLDEEPQS